MVEEVLDGAKRFSFHLNNGLIGVGTERQGQGRVAVYF
jgi:hypothetical protein